jgi:CDP-diacylglycerol--serine O-phosphatidyltransferase
MNLLRVIRKNIPNAITSLNLFCGCVALVFAFDNDTVTAAFFILAAAVFDFCDGFAARLLKAYSPMGKELDSLADVVSFGVAPSAIVFSMLADGTCFNPFLSFGAFLIAVFSALRLAKFNIDTRQNESFIGLPTPACALFFCGLTSIQNIDSRVLAALIPVFCFLLVCELPMFSLKIKKQAGFQHFIKKYCLQILLAVCAIIFVAVFGLAGISYTIALYILLSLWYWVVSSE